MSLNEFGREVEETFCQPIGINLSIKEFEAGIKDGKLFQMIWSLELKSQGSYC